MGSAQGDVAVADQQQVCFEDSASVLSSPEFLAKCSSQKFSDSHDVCNLSAEQLQQVVPEDLLTMPSQDLKISPSQDLKITGSQDLKAPSEELKMMCSQGLQMNFTIKEAESFYIPLEDLHFLGVLGAGGFAVVEKAKWRQQEGPPQLVAVKRLKADVINNEGELQAFSQEMAILKNIQHKNIAAFYGAGGTDDPLQIHEHPPYLVQELVAGGSLKLVLYKQCLANPKRMYSERTALNWMLDIAEGLEHLHSLRPMVIHRDLKPDNVLLSGSVLEEATAKLVDFGLATVASRRRSFKVQLVTTRQRSMSRTKTFKSFSRNLSLAGNGSMQALNRNNSTGSSRNLLRTLSRNISHQLSRQGSASSQVPSILEEKFALSKATGSYFYMAPEVYRGEPYNERVDVFSFAIIMYELLHRRILMSTLIVRGTHDEVEDYARRVSEGERPALHPNLHPRVRDLIERCWAGESIKRPTMREVVDNLHSILTSGEISNEVDKIFDCDGGRCTIS